MSKKTGTAKGYRVDVIPIEKGGTIGTPETMDFPTAQNMRAVKSGAKTVAEIRGLSSVLVIEESAIRIVQKWRVDFEDILKCPSFEWLGDPVEVVDIPDDIDSDDE